MGKSKYIITINRQFGSMGRPIAKIVAEKLGIEFYDREIIDKAANELNLPASVIEEQEESASLPVKTFSRMMFPLGKGASDTQDKIFDAQQRIIKFLAEKENCVIVGRCSDFILDEFDNVMHVYIYAPYKERLKNSIEELGLSEKEAKKMMKAVDEARDDYQMQDRKSVV